MTQTQQFDGTEHITMYHEPERTSIAAILGLVCSCIGCCGGLTAIPGVFLSIFGIVGISRSKGRIGGMGFAIAGLLIGLLMMALWGGALGAAFAGVKWMEDEAVAPTVEILRDIEAGNFDEARNALGSPASGVSDEVLIEFREGYLATLGPVAEGTKGVGELFTSYGEMVEQMERFNGRPNHIPFPVIFDSGVGLVVIEINPTGANNGSIAPTRIYVVDSNGNESVLPPYDWVDPNPGATQDADGDMSGVDVEDFSDSADDATDVVPDDGP
ncbi:MAG: DUF4190 domain-containing protein [Phycisphaerales bacterium]